MSFRSIQFIAVIKDSLAYSNDVFKTYYITPTFEQKLLKINEKGLPHL